MGPVEGGRLHAAAPVRAGHRHVVVDPLVAARRHPEPAVAHLSRGKDNFGRFLSYLDFPEFNYIIFSIFF